MSFATIEDLRANLGGRAPERDPAYVAKMLHKLPAFESVADRTAFIVKHCAGKRVLEFGASGALTQAIRGAAAAYWGVDREAGPQVTGLDLDDVTQELPRFGVLPELIVCGEVLEHLSNPGWFLTRLKARYPGVPVIVTVPNAFTAAGQQWLTKGYENVNADHVAWYSPKTLSVLLERAGYTTGDLYYYNGTGPTAEGLIVVTE